MCPDKKSQDEKMLDEKCPMKICWTKKCPGIIQMSMFSYFHKVELEGAAVPSLPKLLLRVPFNISMALKINMQTEDQKLVY